MYRSTNTRTKNTIKKQLNKTHKLSITDDETALLNEMSLLHIRMQTIQLLGNIHDILCVYDTMWTTSSLTNKITVVIIIIIIWIVMLSFIFPVLREKCLLIPTSYNGYINRKKKIIRLNIVSSLWHSHCCDSILYRNIERTNKYVCTL